MKKQEMSFEWYSNHLYVIEWRNQTTNSTIITAASLGVPIARVSDIINTYAHMLVRSIRKQLVNDMKYKKLRRREWYQDSFKLTEVEANLVYNELRRGLSRRSEF